MCFSSVSVLVDVAFAMASRAVSPALVESPAAPKASKTTGKKEANIPSETGPQCACLVRSLSCAAPRGV